MASHAVLRYAKFPLSALLSRSQRVSRTAGMGQLLPNDDPAMIGWNAPIPVLPALTPEPRRFDPKRSLALPAAMPADASKRPSCWGDEPPNFGGGLTMIVRTSAFGLCGQLFSGRCCDAKCKSSKPTAPVSMPGSRLSRSTGMISCRSKAR
jgi:hypothetical protein